MLVFTRKRKNSNNSGGERNESGSERDDSRLLPGVPELRTEDTICDTKGEPRVVESEVLVNMARNIKPPPVDIRSPKVRLRTGKHKDNQSFGPMPSFEREIQRIIAEQVSMYTFYVII